MKLRSLTFLVPFLVIALAIAIRMGLSDYTDRLSLLSFDFYQRVEPRPFTDTPVRIVEIDDESLTRYGQWPWPRTLLAKLVDRLTEAGAAAVGFDIVFPEPDQTSPKSLGARLEKGASRAAELVPLLADLPDHDEVFAEALTRSNVVLGQVLVSSDSGSLPKPKAGMSTTGTDPFVMIERFDSVITSLPLLNAGAKGLGFLNRHPEWDSVVRRVPLLLRAGETPYPSLSMETLRVALGGGSYIARGAGANNETGFGHNTGMVALRVGKAQIPTDEKGRMWLHYTTAPQPGRYVSAAAVLDGTFDPARIEGNIVLVGASFAGSNDLVATPMTEIMPGVEAHAQVLEQVLQNWFLTRPDWAAAAELVFMLIVGLGLILLLPYVGAVANAAIAVLALAGGAAASWYAFHEWRLLLDPVYPAIVIVIVYALATLLGFMRTEAQQREIRNAFGRYMSPYLVDQLAKHPEKLVLGGEMRTMTLMFCDIRGFTTISEGLDAHQLTQFINAFLSPMSEIILDRRGTIDKYIGDCIMAFWNAPLDDGEHAANAVRSAQAMRRRLVELNAEWEAKAKAEGRQFKPVRMGIGINTGECCVGNMGSHQRFDYSVLGDAVNLASRLEGLGKTYGVDLVIGEETVKLAGSWPLIELDMVAVKGKSQAVRIHTLLPDGEERSQAPAPAVEHQRLLTAYRGQDWATAEGIIAAGLGEKLKYLAYCYDLYKHRIEEFLSAPPPADWDGVYVAKEK